MTTMVGDIFSAVGTALTPFSNALPVFPLAGPYISFRVKNTTSCAGQISSLCGRVSTTLCLLS